MEEAESILKRDIGFSVKYIDRSKNPAKDFYGYCNGKWLEETTIPEDRSRYGAFDMLYEKNMYILRSILEDLQKNSHNNMEKQLGDFYASAMDTERLEKLKFSPIKGEMDNINNATKEKLPELFAELTMKSVQIPFDIGSAEDAKNAEIYSLYIGQGGLSLPDRDYYLNEQMKPILDAYKKHIARMFTLYGYTQNDAENTAERVVSLETELAKFSRSKTDLRDVERAYNKYSMEELFQKFPELGFDRYFKIIGSGNMNYAIMDAPEFFEQAGALLKNTAIENIVSYLKWKVLAGSAMFLHKEAVDENFNFFKKTLLGQEKIAPRWRTVVNVVDASIGDSLGQVYVDKHFGKEAVEKITVLVNDIKAIFKERLENNPWMSKETREKALLKFSKFNAKIGYTEKFKDYSSIEINPDDYIGNVERAASFELNRQLKRIGTKVDKTEWYMTPPTVNAYFNSMGNEIVFPAGIMQPPFFDPEMDDAVNYGGIGGVISHEITHGYDDQGSHFDENGNMVNWWTDEDKKRFDEMAEKVVKLYSSVEILPGLNVNGKLTLGENIADLGAVLIAYEALQKRLKAEPAKNIKIDGLTPEQRFFISWGQVWRTKIRDNEARRLATIDPHSPGSVRSELPPWNHPDFCKTFGLPSSTKEKILMW
ncbi:zinc metalloprotease [Ferroplasma acidiphilum]|uniref:Zinc metalloprotease n=1 Tax=Ferroplasma acidiphilum TaxID=74969 RepID=A0A1V0N3N3_9ARCH|nr:M13 family metallopeptidase [Ferroplasma acidiphilum]ARD84711.1 zinc metalloprotease [Ferroplasma acidiphilum]